MKEKASLESAILDVVNYYAFFGYAPAFLEIWTFLSIKTPKKKLQETLEALVKQNDLKKLEFELNSNHYTIPSLRISKEGIMKKRLLAKDKLTYLGQYTKLLSYVPQITLVGISGSVSMGQSSSEDDIDIFIITAPYRLWTGRIISIIIASLIGLRRVRGLQKAPNKVCLNLFFDEIDLAVPAKKRNLYTAHEVLQMKPRVAKGDIYERFLKANEWVHHFFPNARPLDDRFPAPVGSLPSRSAGRASQVAIKRPSSLIGNIAEKIFKKLQLYLINRHETTEIITPTQLWFFPRDFEEKLRRKNIIT